MKNKVILILGLISMFFVSACSQLDGGTINGDYTGNCKLYVMADAEDHLSQVFEMNGARTILPAALTGTGLTFKLSGVSNRGEVLTEQTLVWNAAGKAEVTLSYARWTLTLKAFDGDGDLVLSDQTYIDLTNGGSEIRFIMKPDASTGTKGNVSITGNYINYTNTQVTPNTKIVSKIVAGLYNKDDVTLLSPVHAFADVTAINGSISYTTAAKTITAGNYNFIMSFRDADDNEIGFYSELVIVDPGNTSTKVFTDLDVINQVPVAPTELKAFYVENSAKNGFYDVKLTWKDESTNEKYFNLVVTEYEDNTTPKVGDPYADVNGNIITYDNLYVAGSLAASSETVTIKLPLGRMFDIKLCAVGVGKSTYCERETAASETGFTGYDAANERITLTEVKHLLDGGSLSLSGTPYNGAIYTTYQIYKTTTPVTLMNIDGTTNVLVKVDGSISHPFTKWQKYDETNKKYVDYTTVVGFGNVTVKACYNLNYVISYEIPGYDDLDPSWVSCVYGAGNTNCLNSTIDAKTIQTVTVTVDNDAAHSIVFDEFEYRLNNQILYSGDYTSMTSPNVYSFDTSNLDSKLYIVTVMARQKNTDKWFSYTFGITVCR